MPIGSLVNYLLLDAWCRRQSRRVGLGKKLAAGPLPFGDDEEVLLAIATCGIAGHQFGDLT